MGGIKDMSSPPCQNMGGIYHPHPPQDLRPWLQAILLFQYAIAHQCCLSKSRTVTGEFSLNVGAPR